MAANNGKSFPLNNKRQGNRKLTYGQVQDIRTRYEHGATQAQLGREYEMSVVQIGRVVRGESWRDAGMAVITQEERMASVVVPSDEELAARMARVMEEAKKPLPPPTQQELDVKRAAEVRERFFAGVPASPLDGGDILDETGGLGLQKLVQTAKEEGEQNG
jgi:hypothetical protein